MEDSPESETKNVSMSVEDDEIDPLDAYMLEIDQQVQTLDEKDKLKSQTAAMKLQDTVSPMSTHDSVDVDEEDDEETIGKAGNFATVEELIA